jgi:hypothetical protein
VLRICVSSSAERPEPRTTFETLPLTAKSVAAVATIAYPSRTLWSGGPSGSKVGASTIGSRLSP